MWRSGKQSKAGEREAQLRLSGKSTPFPAAGRKPAKKPKFIDNIAHAVHDVYKVDNYFLCRKCPASCSTSNSGCFRRVGCFGDRAHDFVSHRKGPVKCSNCGETAANVKQMKGKLSFACPGPSKCEPSFLHDIPAKPDSKGNYVCRRCKRSSVKSSVARFAKTLCYGSHATNRSDAICASRCAAGLSSKGLPDNVSFAKVQCQHGAGLGLHHNGARMLSSKLRPRYPDERHSRARSIPLKRKSPGDPRPLRFDRHPNGLPNLLFVDRIKVSKANKLYFLTSRIAQWATEHGCLFCIENPQFSYFWQTTFIQSVIHLMNFTTFQSCMMYGSTRPKRTMLGFNAAEFAVINKMCSGVSGT